MRQTKTNFAIVAAVIVIIGTLALFGLGRAWLWRGRDQVDRHPGNQVVQNGETPEPSGELVGDVRVIEVAARQFEFDPAVIVVREGENVRLEVTSEDVAHGIGIADYDIDRRLEPETTEVIEFTAESPGRHHIHCSVYCGVGHGDMHGELIVIASE